MLHNRTLLKHGSRLYLQDAALFNKPVLYASQLIRKGRNGAEGREAAHIIFVWLHTAKSNLLWGLAIFIVPHIHFGKAEVANCHPQTWKP